MRILHYTLGLSPQRSGGLTKYATDLMQEQQKENQVFLLYPSGYRWWSWKIYWKKGVVKSDIETVKLKNTFPIPLLYGIKSTEYFVFKRKMTQNTMESLYKVIHPDVFHVHTLMGVPKELLLFFKDKGVKLIYTSHDYFGLCPKVNFINAEGKLCTLASESNCRRCNDKAPSTLFLRLRNSNLVLNIKNNPFLRKLLH